MSRSCTPRARSALSTAFITAGIAPLQPDSPTPFAPFGPALGVSVSTQEMSIRGASEAVTSIYVVGQPEVVYVQPEAYVGEIIPAWVRGYDAFDGSGYFSFDDNLLTIGGTAATIVAADRNASDPTSPPSARRNDPPVTIISQWEQTLSDGVATRVWTVNHTPNR